MQVKKHLLEPTWNNGLVPNGERSIQGYVLSPCLFNFSAEYIMKNAGLDEAQAGIKIAERNINSLRYADYTLLTAESEELKDILMKVKVERNIDFADFILLVSSVIVFSTGVSRKLVLH